MTRKTYWRLNVFGVYQCHLCYIILQTSNIEKSTPHSLLKCQNAIPCKMLESDGVVESNHPRQQIRFNIYAMENFLYKYCLSCKKIIRMYITKLLCSKYPYHIIGLPQITLNVKCKIVKRTCDANLSTKRCHLHINTQFKQIFAGFNTVDVYQCLLICILVCCQEFAKKVSGVATQSALQQQGNLWTTM